MKEKRTTYLIPYACNVYIHVQTLTTLSTLSPLSLLSVHTSNIILDKRFTRLRSRRQLLSCSNNSHVASLTDQILRVSYMYIYTMDMHIKLLDVHLRMYVMTKVSMVHVCTSTTYMYICIIQGRPLWRQEIGYIQTCSLHTCTCI